MSFPSWGETLTMDDLVKRNDLYYKKFNNVPFTGEISVNKMEVLRKEETGEWLYYDKNGQLKDKINFKDRKKDGHGSRINTMTVVC